MEKPKSPPPPPPRPTTSATANNRLLQNIKSLLIKCAIASNPAKKSLTPLQEAFIEKRIQEIFPNIHTPDHPPYAWMIENAIQELNEEGGSSEESISQFIIQKYKDLPFAHVALLDHHLRKLCESDDLVRSRNGCYSMVQSSIHLNRTPEPNPSVTNTTCLIPILTSSPSRSPSPDPSCSSSPAYESSSSESFSPKRRRRKRMNKKKVNRKKSRRVRIHTDHNSGRARGRCLGSGSGCAKPEETIMGMHADLVVDDEAGINHTEATGLKYLMADDENIGIQDSINVESRALESGAVVETEPLRQEKLVSGENSSTPSTIRSSRGKKVNVGPHKRSVRSMHARRSGRRRGRPRKREVLMEEYGKNNVANITECEIKQAEQDDQDTLDDLIDEVYMELMGTSETQSTQDQPKRDGTELMLIEIRDHAEELMQCKLNQQSDIIDLEKADHHRPVEESKEMGIATSEMEEGRQLRRQPPKFQQDQTGQFGLSMPGKYLETVGCRKLRPRSSKNEFG